MLTSHQSVSLPTITQVVALTLLLPLPTKLHLAYVLVQQTQPLKFQQSIVLLVLIVIGSTFYVNAQHLMQRQYRYAIAQIQQQSFKPKSQLQQAITISVNASKTIQTGSHAPNVNRCSLSST
jgi:hypothetical protein